MKNHTHTHTHTHTQGLIQQKRFIKTEPKEKILVTPLHTAGNLGVGGGIPLSHRLSILRFPFHGVKKCSSDCRGHKNARVRARKGAHTCARARVCVYTDDSSWRKRNHLFPFVNRFVHENSVQGFISEAVHLILKSNQLNSPCWHTYKHRR